MQPWLQAVGLLSIGKLNGPKAGGDLVIPFRQLCDPQWNLGSFDLVRVALCANPKGDRKVVRAAGRKLARTAPAMWMR